MSPRSDVKQKAHKWNFGNTLGSKPVVFLPIALLIASTAVAVYEYTQAASTIGSSNATLNNPGYLGGSKLFLISANASYKSVSGKACLVINATVRNDYTAQNPPPMDNYPGNSSGMAYFGLTATLYVKNTQLQSEDINSGAPLGVSQIGLSSGDTYVYEIDMATSSHNVNSFSIDLVMVAGYPIP